MILYLNHKLNEGRGKLKKKFSTEKAEWSDLREKQYRQDCLDIVFQFGEALTTRDDKVYLIKNGEETELSRPLKQKTF